MVVLAAVAEDVTVFQIVVNAVVIITAIKIAVVVTDVEAVVVV